MKTITKVILGLSLSQMMFATEIEDLVNKTELEKKVEIKISSIMENIKSKMKGEAKEKRRIKIETIDEAKVLKTKMTLDYEAYMVELKKQSNDLKNNRYTRDEYKRLQKTIVELTKLHKKKQEEIIKKIDELIEDRLLTDKMIELKELFENQKEEMDRLGNDYKNIKANHINHKSILKDTFYMDLENLKIKYVNDQKKLQKLYKININKLLKSVDEKKTNLRLTY